MQKILIIEDDIGILNSLKLYFSQSGFKVFTCDNGNLAIPIFEQNNPDLIILDINLPGKNGIEICREIREKSITPIIILSARGDEEDKILALDLGADDYVSKPFSPRELLARVNSVLKRFSTISQNKKDDFLQYKNLKLDLKNFSVSLNSEILKTTKTEFLLLKYIIENREDLILRENLMKDIMGYEHYVYDRTLDTHIKNLRRKIGDEFELETVRGIGYRVK